MVESKVFPKLIADGEDWIIDRIREIIPDKKNYHEISDLLSYILVLMKHYHYGNFEYNEDDYITVAEEMRVRYKEKKLKVYHQLGMGSKQPKDKVSIFREFVLRGFIPEDLCTIDRNKEMYIQAKIGSLMYPKTWDKPGDYNLKVYPFFIKIGIPGFTGIKDPYKTK